MNELHRGMASAGPVPFVPGYEILEVLGRGGMGVVYKARHLSLRRLVALKMIQTGAHASPGDLARFQGEAEVVARLRHPNIVQIFEVGDSAGLQYISLELIEGGTLQKRLGGMPQPARPAARLVEILARTIQFAHQQGIVHRDLKPDNVLLATVLPGDLLPTDPDAVQVAALYGMPRIADFGLVKHINQTTVKGGPTLTGQVMGTPSYMAPEQAAGENDRVGPAADVYALGAILYQLLTGRPPFMGATPLDTLYQAANEEPIRPGRLRPNLPRDLERICLKCLEKDPKRRYAGAGELADDLRRHLDGETVLARPASPPEWLWRWARRNPIASSLLLAISLGSALGFWSLSRLTQSLVRSSALDCAAQQSEMLDEFNKYYSRVVGHLKPAGVTMSHEWEKDPKAAPFPATLTIELGEQLAERDESKGRVRLYSDYPFRLREKSRVLDDFEREALARLRENPDLPHYSFEKYRGRSVLRYATARVMAAGCVHCHNTHPQTPKKDWKEGDVRGVLEIIRPLDQDEARIRKGLHSTMLLGGAVGASLLALSGLFFFLGGRRRPLRSLSSGGEAQTG